MPSKFNLLTIYFILTIFVIKMNSSDLKKELIDMGFDLDHINIALQMTNRKEEVINL